MTKKLADREQALALAQDMKNLGLVGTIEVGRIKIDLRPPEAVTSGNEFDLRVAAK